MPKNITTIDIYNLHTALAEQADLFKEWSDKLADAEADLDDLKTELDLVKAEIADSVRRDPQSYGANASKLSEAMIDRMMPMQPEYQKAKRDVLDGERKVGRLKSAVKALDQKKTALEKLTALWIGGYYADPKVPRMIPGAVVRGMPAGIDKKKGGK